MRQVPSVRFTMPGGEKVTLRYDSHHDAEIGYMAVKPEHLDAEIRWFLEPTWWDRLVAKIKSQPTPRSSWPALNDDWPPPPE